MGVELLVKPGRSPFVDSDTHEIRAGTVGIGAVSFFALAVAGAGI
jgi:hypothetical protein